MGTKGKRLLHGLCKVHQSVEHRVEVTGRPISVLPRNSLQLFFPTTGKWMAWGGSELLALVGVSRYMVTT